VGTTRMWLILVAVQFVTLVLLASVGSITTTFPALRYVGLACAAGLFICIPPLALKGFIAGQLRIGNGDLRMVRGVQRHEAAVIFGFWLMMGAALLMALPRIRSDMRAEREAAAAMEAANALMADSQKYMLPDATRSAAGSAASTSSDTGSSAAATRNAPVQVTTPGPDSPLHTAIVDALRNRLKSSGRFRVDHIRAAGKWAFVRATETVTLDGGETQETDNTIAALLELPAGSKMGWWRIVDVWTLPGEADKPLAEFTRRVRQRLRAEGVPETLLPADL
jgi:hypothetical protein